MFIIPQEKVRRAGNRYAANVALLRGRSRICHVETTKLHVDAVINKVFLIMFLMSGQAQDMVSPSRRSMDATLVGARMSR